jgi:hypothetical protein
MFRPEDRNRIQDRLLDLAAADEAVVGAAIVGSEAAGQAERWSDIDVNLAVDGPLDAVLEQWTRRLYDEFGALHHWDLPVNAAIYRVFLLPGVLEADLGFVPAADFGPSGPHWRLVFGTAAGPGRPAFKPDVDGLAGLAWHHALHARISIERGRRWQAEHWISALRNHVITLACLRLGLPTAYAKGAHLLPAEVTDRLAQTLLGSLDEAALRQALGAVSSALLGELECADAGLADRLRPAFDEVVAPMS